MVYKNKNPLEGKNSDTNNNLVVFASIIKVSATHIKARNIELTTREKKDIYDC